MINACPTEPNAQRSASSLSEEVRAGLPVRDAAALEAMFDLYFPKIHGYVSRLVSDEGVTEDLTQDIFFRIYRALPGYEPSRDWGPWAFTIATNCVRDYWRTGLARRRETDVSLLSDESLPRASQVALPESGLEHDELAESVRSAIDQLPDSMRMAVVLRTYEGLSFEAIGRILNRNAVAVRKRYSRALGTLRESLEATYEVYLET